MATALSALCLPMQNVYTPKVWRARSNAPAATNARMAIFAAGTVPVTIVEEGPVIADGSGNFDLRTYDVNQPGTKRFAMVHNWNGVTGTTSIHGFVGIAELTAL
jgi:NCAIR mutase (PurE)-related protein